VQGWWRRGSRFSPPSLLLLLRSCFHGWSSSSISGGQGAVPATGGVDPVAGTRHPKMVLARRGYDSGATYAAVAVRLVCRACLPAPLPAAGAAAGRSSPSAPVRCQRWPGVPRRASVARQASARQRAKVPPPAHCRLLLRQRSYDDILFGLIWGGPATGARGLAAGTPTVMQRAYVRVQGLSSDAVRAVWPRACRRWGCMTVAALPTVLLKGLLC
jgi:hypothetical protein